MDLRRTNRHAWLVSGYIGLSLLVFAWGLGYKLSLYAPPHSESHKILQAKLLSKNEKAPATESPLLSGTQASTAAFGVVLSSALLFLVPSFRSLDAAALSQLKIHAKQSWRLRHHASLSFFFVLPPPVLS